MQRHSGLVAAGVILAWLTCAPAPALASSHMDAPLITLDDAANTTDVYAFVAQRGQNKFLQVALGVYPHEEPGVGPNIYRFDDSVLYEIHLLMGGDLATGERTRSYQFRFYTLFKNQDTILQHYTGVVPKINSLPNNMQQLYTVDILENEELTPLGEGRTPPNNQGIATPLYNVGDNGNNPAKSGVSTTPALDKYTRQATYQLEGGYRVFAGQREDGFYGDINAIFDLLNLRAHAKDSQAGFNIHMIALEIPISALGGDEQVVGVYATTSRPAITILDDGSSGDYKTEAKHAASSVAEGCGCECGPGVAARLERGGIYDFYCGPWIQIARQGNPLFNEAFVAIKDKDIYSRRPATEDAARFTNYAKEPELAKLMNAILGTSAPETDRTDLVGLFIPDVLKVDLSTGPARLAGNGPAAGSNPDDPGFSRLSIFGGDTLTSGIGGTFCGGPIPGGWPNGRRFGDDVVDIGIIAVLSDLRTCPPVISVASDNMNANDSGYSKVFPYAGTPHNGRVHSHP